MGLQAVAVGMTPLPATYRPAASQTGGGAHGRSVVDLSHPHGALVVERSTGGEGQWRVVVQGFPQRAGELDDGGPGGVDGGMVGGGQGVVNPHSRQAVAVHLGGVELDPIGGL